jgi:hydrogenase expression/formation protein HypD
VIGPAAGAPAEGTVIGSAGQQPSEAGGQRPLEFRDPQRGRALLEALERWTRDRVDDPVSVMHVCGSHEQAIARFGLRSALPPGLRVIPGPGCPVCVTDAPEIDEAVALAEAGIRVLSYGDMLRVPGSRGSLADARAAGARVEVVYSVVQAAELARAAPGEPLVFFATGFETTAVATAALLLGDPPGNLSLLSAHKYIPPVMEIVAEMPATRVEGFLAAGHAASITGWGVFEPFVARHRLPVAIGGFEPLDLLAGFAALVERIRSGRPGVDNCFPRMVTRHGNLRAQAQLWRVFQPAGGVWRGITRVPNGNLRLRPEWERFDARQRFAARLAGVRGADAPATRSEECRCGDIMAGIASPGDCALYAKTCTPARPVGACMVSSEGTCRIWHEYGGLPQLAGGRP